MFNLATNTAQILLNLVTNICHHEQFQHIEYFQYSIIVLLLLQGDKKAKDSKCLIASLRVYSCSSSFDFSLFRVTTTRKSSPYDSINFVSFPCLQHLHVFSHQIHRPSLWPSSLSFTMYCHLYHFPQRCLLLSS